MKTQISHFFKIILALFSLAVLFYSFCSFATTTKIDYVDTKNQFAITEYVNNESRKNFYREIYSKGPIGNFLTPTENDYSSLSNLMKKHLKRFQESVNNLYITSSQQDWSSEEYKRPQLNLKTDNIAQEAADQEAIIDKCKLPNFSQGILNEIDEMKTLALSNRIGESYSKYTKLSPLINYVIEDSSSSEQIEISNAFSSLQDILFFDGILKFDKPQIISSINIKKNTMQGRLIRHIFNLTILKNKNDLDFFISRIGIVLFSNSEKKTNSILFKILNLFESQMDLPELRENIDLISALSFKKTPIFIEINKSNDKDKLIRSVSKIINDYQNISSKSHTLTSNFIEKLLSKGQI